jgi:hypothetical protein
MVPLTPAQIAAIADAVALDLRQKQRETDTGLSAKLDQIIVMIQANQVDLARLETLLKETRGDLDEWKQSFVEWRGTTIKLFDRHKKEYTDMNREQSDRNSKLEREMANINGRIMVTGAALAIIVALVLALVGK